MCSAEDAPSGPANRFLGWRVALAVGIVLGLAASPTFRVLYLGTFCFLWINILCVIKNIDSYREKQPEIVAEV